MRDMDFVGDNDDSSVVDGLDSIENSVVDG